MTTGRLSCTLRATSESQLSLLVSLVLLLVAEGHNTPQQTSLDQVPVVDRGDPGLVDISKLTCQCTQVYVL